MNRGNIGFFDSGVGGLFIYKEIIRLMPWEDTIYIADQKYLPYSEKSTNKIQDRALKISKRLVTLGSSLIVIACNTATVSAINLLRNKFKIPFVGIEPAVKPAAKMTKTKEILVLATSKTIQSNSQQKLIEAYGNNIVVHLHTLPKVVKLIERGEVNSKEIQETVEKVLNNKRLSNVDVIVLSCTHYPFIKPIIKRVRKNIKVYDPSLPVARQVYNLRKKSVKKSGNIKGKHIFFSTKNHHQFQKVAEKLLKIPIESQHLSI